MTWNNPPPIKPLEIKAGKKITPEMLAASGSEDGHQAAVMCWAADSVGKYPDLKWLHSIPNGGLRDKISAGKLKATGVKSGVWDIFLPKPMLKPFTIPYNGFEMWRHGCYIEMKKPIYRNRKNGGLSDEQVEFGKYAEAMEYYCKVCYTWEEAKDCLIAYLEGKV